METENPKPQTGGLKLMTVFIVVLALHVVVIGGISAYQLLKKRSGDVASNTPPKDATTETTDTTKTDDSTATAQNDASGTAQNPAPDAQASTSNPTPNAPQPGDSSTTTGSHVTTTPPTPANPTPMTPTPAPIPTQAKVTQPVSPVVEKPVASASTVEVTVKPGDSLFKIAKHNHTTVDSIKKLNSLASDNLKIGQKLKVTAKVGAPASAPAAPAPAGVTDASAVAKADKPAFKASAKLAKEAVAAPATTEAASPAVYTVAKGDTLTKIAKHFNTTASAIMSANNLTNPGKLSIGAKLRIPSQQARNTVTPETTTPVIQPKAAPVQSSDMVMADRSVTR